MWIKNASDEPHGFGGHEIAPGGVIKVSNAEFEAAQRNVGILDLFERHALIASAVELIGIVPVPAEVESKKGK